MTTNTSKASEKWHKKIEKLLDDSGFSIVESDYYKKGPDIVAEFQNYRVIVQCKCAEEEGRSINISPLIDEYSRKVEKENAFVAVLAISTYSIADEYRRPEERDRLLREDKVVVWEDKDYEYYKRVVGALGKWAKFPILGDLGCKEPFSAPLSVPAMKMEQGAWEFFIFVISPEDLLQVADVLRRVRDPRSYQRMVDKTRVTRDIKEFLERPEAIFPTNLVCVFKEEAIFDAEKKELHIPMKYSSVWIVDGQHRLYAFCHVKDEIRKNFKLFCAGFNVSGYDASKLDQERQADIFVSINIHAKKVSKQLLIAIALSFGFADRRIRIVERLKKTDTFKDKIQSIDTKGPIDITTFVETAPMSKLLGNSGILSKWYGRKGEPKEIPDDREEVFLDFCFKLMRKYFRIVREVLPNEWENSEEYILATNRGIRALLRIMECVLDYTNGLADIEKAKDCFNCLKGRFDFSTFKNRRMYLGEGGANALAEHWMGIVRDMYPDFGPRPRVLRFQQIEPGQEKEAERIVKEELIRFDGEVVGELKHIDPTTFSYLKHIPLHCPIRLFIDGSKNDGKCHEELEKLAKERGGVPIEIRTIRKVSESAFIHDRWLSDGNVMMELGIDLKEDSLGKSRHIIRATDLARTTSTYRTFMENWGGSPEELKNKGAQSWPFYIRKKRFKEFGKDFDYLTYNQWKFNRFVKELRDQGVKGEEYRRRVAEWRKENP